MYRYLTYPIQAEGMVIPYKEGLVYMNLVETGGCRLSLPPLRYVRRPRSGGTGGSES